MAMLLVWALLSTAAGDVELELRRHCAAGGSDPGNPWALAHGLRAFGPRFRASDGRLASEAVVHDFLRRVPLGFPVSTPAGVPVEPHPDLILKTLVSDARLGPSTKLPTSWGTVTVAALTQALQARFAPPTSTDDWREVDWTLDVLAETTRPHAQWSGAGGVRVFADELFDRALAELEAETAPLRTGLDAGRAEVPKQTVGLSAHACGGLHFVQAVLAWARHPEVSARWGARVDRQVELLLYRVGSERRQYDAALRLARAQAPQLEVSLHAQRLKFYGHLLETLGRLSQELGWTPTGPQRAVVALARDELTSAVEALRSRGAFSSATLVPRLRLDLVGDACHAAWGLGAWRAPSGE